jgi:AcrR family transcriptional regulator
LYRRGIPGVGIKKIAMQAGVVKICLYRSFSSQDDLIVAYLDRCNAAFRKQIDEEFFVHQKDLLARLRAIMPYRAGRTTPPGLRGRPFINYSAAFAEPSTPGRVVAQATNCECQQRMTQIAHAMGAPHPKQRADALLPLAKRGRCQQSDIGTVRWPRSCNRASQ